MVLKQNLLRIDPRVKCYHKIRITTTKGHKETRVLDMPSTFDCGDMHHEFADIQAHQLHTINMGFYVNYY